MTYNQLRDIIIERTTELTKCKYQNDINQKKLLEAQARIAELDSALDACLSGERIPVAVTNRTDDAQRLSSGAAETRPLDCKVSCLTAEGKNDVCMAEANFRPEHRPGL